LKQLTRTEEKDRESHKNIFLVLFEASFLASRSLTYSGIS
jgi:hypothetical protein